VEPVGNCGVGILEGPGSTTIAAGLSKGFHITERIRLRFEGTFTNLLNHPNFAPPPTNVTASSFGIVQSVQTSENSGNRKVQQIEITIEFHDPFNQVVLRDKQRLFLPTAQPFMPGQQRDVQIPYEHIPVQWNNVFPSIVVTGLSFK